MRMPPFFIGATLLLWGYEKNMIILGVGVALLLEMSNFSPRRWQLDINDFVKISDLTSIILLSSTVLIVLNYDAKHFLKIIAGWMPLILLPLALAQIYGANDKIMISTRLGPKRSKVYMHKPMDFSFFYLVVILFSAATGNSRHQTFLPILLCLSGWIIFVNRGKSFSRFHLFLPLIVVAILSFTISKGLESGHAHIEQIAMDLWENYFHNKGADPIKPAPPLVMLDG